MLTSIVRSVCTLDGRYPIYQDTSIYVTSMDTSELCPTSKYVLRPKLKFLDSLGDVVFNLRERVVVQGQFMSPPIIEWSDHDDCYLIVDGLHRCFLARTKGIEINCVIIEGVPFEFPVIGFPVPWRKVKVRRRLPRNPKQRRDLRTGIPNESHVLRKYYRDLSCLGSGGRRPAGSQTS